MLNIEEDESVLCETGNEIDPVKIGNKKYKMHPNYFKVQTVKNVTEFYFAPIDEYLIAKEIQNL